MDPCRPPSRPVWVPGPPACGQKAVGLRPAGLRLIVLEAVPGQPCRAGQPGGSADKSPYGRGHGSRPECTRLAGPYPDWKATCPKSRECVRPFPGRRGTASRTQSRRSGVRSRTILTNNDPQDPGRAGSESLSRGAVGRAVSGIVVPGEIFFSVGLSGPDQGSLAGG